MLSRQQLTECQILRGVARVLELSAVATSTALTFLHRVHQQQQQQQGQQQQHGLSSQELVCACTYLAAKVEEVHVSTNQLINTARVLADPSQHHLLQALAPLQLRDSLPQQQQQQQQHAAGTGSSPPRGQQHTPPAAASSSQHQQQTGDTQKQQPQQQQQQPAHPPQPSTAIVVGDAYYAAKQQLFDAEQVVLRLMRFELGTDQPHKYLLNFCRLLEVPQQAAAAAVCVLNDAVAYTPLLVYVQHGAAEVAAAALQYVLLQQGAGGDGEQQQGDGRCRGASNVAIAADQRQGGGWIQLVGLQPGLVADAVKHIEGFYEACL